MGQLRRPDSAGRRRSRAGTGVRGPGVPPAAGRFGEIHHRQDKAADSQFPEQSHRDGPDRSGAAGNQRGSLPQGPAGSFRRGVL